MAAVRHVKNDVTARCGLSVSSTMPNLVTIAQTAAELLRLSAFQNGGRSSSWILLQPKNDIRGRCGLSWPAAYQNLVKISQIAVELWIFSFFSKRRPPPSWILLDFIFRPFTKSNWWPEAIFKILCQSDLYFRRYCDFNCRKFGLKCLFGPINWCFGGFHPLNISGYHRDPQTALPCVEPDILTYRSSISVNRGDLQARWRNEKKKRKTQTSDISRLHRDHPRRPIAPILGS